MPNRTSEILIRSHFRDNSFVQPDIDSFNSFITKELERILEERFAGADTACLNVDACRRLFDRKEYKLDPDELYVSSTVLETSGVQHLADLGFAQQAATLSLDIAVLEDRAKHIVVPERFLSNEAS